MKKRVGILSLFVATLITLISFISAQSYDFRTSPAYLLQNEWFVFALIFLLAFAVIYLGLGNVFGKSKKNKMFPWIEEASQTNRGAVVIISAVLAFLIAAAISQRVLISSYFGQEIGYWMIFSAVIIAIIFATKVAHDKLGGAGAGVMLMLVWVLLRTLNPYTIFPYYITTYNFLSIYSIIIHPAVIVILAILTFVLALKGKRAKKSE